MIVYAEPYKDTSIPCYKWFTIGEVVTIMESLYAEKSRMDEFTVDMAVEDFITIHWASKVIIDIPTIEEIIS